MSDFQQAVILHRRLYRETSLLLELLTENTGYCTVLAKGAHGAGATKNKNKNLAGLQAFNLLRIRIKLNKNHTVAGDSLGLLLESEVEQTGLLSGRYLVAGLYLNELLATLCRTQKAVDLNILKAYWQAIIKLQHAIEPIQILLILRLFECELLKQLGFELNLKSVNIDPDQQYQYRWDQGLCLAQPGETGEPGQIWLNYQAQKFENRETSRLAQQLFSQVLWRYCEFSTGNLKTRALWQGIEQGGQNS